MIDLTARQIELVLWHFKVVDSSYGLEPPEGSTLYEIDALMRAELQRLELEAASEGP